MLNVHKSFVDPGPPVEMPVAETNPGTIAGNSNGDLNGRIDGIQRLSQLAIELRETFAARASWYAYSQTMNCLFPTRSIDITSG